MPRRRKIAIAVDEDDSEKMKPPPPPPPLKKKLTVIAANKSPSPTENRVQNKQSHPIFLLFEKAQANESLHAKYIKELQQMYAKMEHDTFMIFFLKGLRTWMRFDEANTFASTGLRFMAKFLTSFNDDDETHPILSSVLGFLLNTISQVTLIRFRLCQFVNLILGSMSAEAALDDTICNNIMKYMTDRLKDYVASVRVQAVQALQRLQAPDNPNDIIVRLYMFHLANDTSPLVRQAVLTAMGRNSMTIPAILDRLWDIDERVRRHAYLQMSSYPVKAYKVVQRIIFLEQGLNDHSEMVRKVVTGVLLPQWLQLYNKEYISFISALKLDANEDEIKRFMKIAKQALFEIFKTEKVEKLIEALPLATDGEFERCVPFEKLTVEVAVYWLALIEYLQHLEANDEFEDRLQQCVCELSTYCSYLSHCCNQMREQAFTDNDRWSIQENQYKFITLMEILLTFDLGDEIGRQNLKAFISNILSTQILNENNIQKLIQCVENLIPDTEMRLQYFIEVVRSIVDPSTSINDKSVIAVIEAIKDPIVRMKASALGVHIMELREQENIASQQKNYERLEKLAEEIAAHTEKFIRLVNETSDGDGDRSSNLSFLSSLQSKKLSVEWIQQSLLICFYAVASKYTDSLTPNMCHLYKDFIRRQMESKQMFVRNWALKCGTAFSKLYEQLAKDVYNELHKQFYRHQHTRIWTTCINATFELIDQYGFDYFEADAECEKSTEKGKKTRQLYNTMGYLDEPDEDESTSRKSGVELMYLFGHFLDTCSEASIAKALVTGFCRLVVGGHYESSELVSKLLLRFFNPATDPEINQILGIFFETLIKRRRQECLAKALLPTLCIITEASNDSPLQEIKPETVIKFVVNSTIPSYCSPGLNIHNDIAVSFLNHMNDHATNKELLKILSKELLTLEITDDQTLRDDLKKFSDNLLERTIDGKTESYIKSFKEVLAGTYKGAEGTRATQNENPDQDEVPTDDEATNEEVAEKQKGAQAEKVTETEKVAADSIIDMERNMENEKLLEVPETEDEASICMHVTGDLSPIPAESKKLVEVPETEDEASICTHVTGDMSPIRAESSSAFEKVDKTRSVASKKSASNQKEKEDTSELQTQDSLSSDEEIPKTPVKITQARKNKQPVAAAKTKSVPAATKVEKKTDTKIANNRNNVKRAKIDQTPSISSMESTEKMSSISSMSSSEDEDVENESDSTSISRSPSRKKFGREGEKTKEFRGFPQPVVKLNRMASKQSPNSSYRTRNALVAEYKNQNIMTRNRLSLDQMKSPTRRIEHLRKISNNTLPLPSTKVQPDSTNQTPLNTKSTTGQSTNTRSTSNRVQNNNKSTTQEPQRQTQTRATKQSQPTQIPVRINGLKRTRTQVDKNPSKTEQKSIPITSSPKHSSTPVARRRPETLVQRAKESPSVSPAAKRRNAGAQKPVLTNKIDQPNERNLRAKKTNSLISLSENTTAKNNKNKANVTLGKRSNSLSNLKVKENKTQERSLPSKTAAAVKSQTTKTRTSTRNHCSIRPKRK